MANLSVHPEVGPVIAQDKDMVDHFFCVLGALSTMEGSVICSLGNSQSTVVNLEECFFTVFVCNSACGLLFFEKAS